MWACPILQLFRFFKPSCPLLSSLLPRYRRRVCYTPEKEMICSQHSLSPKYINFMTSKWQECGMPSSHMTYSTPHPPLHLNSFQPSLLPQLYPATPPHVNWRSPNPLPLLLSSSTDSCRADVVEGKIKNDMGYLRPPTSPFPNLAPPPTLKARVCFYTLIFQVIMD